MAIKSHFLFENNFLCVFYVIICIKDIGIKYVEVLIVKYENIKVLEINPVVYLGEEFTDNDWRYNQKIFKEKVRDLDFEVGFSIECPIEDLIYVQVDYDDDFEPLAKKETIDKIFSVSKELIKLFEDNVKINLYLDDYMEDGSNSVDMSIEEFTVWLKSELSKYESK